MHNTYVKYFSINDIVRELGDDVTRAFFLPFLSSTHLQVAILHPAFSTKENVNTGMYGKIMRGKLK